MNYRNQHPAVGFSRLRRWAAVIVLSASLLVITMDMTILNIALPSMAADLHPTSDQQLWIVDIYSLMLAGLLASSAAVGDRWGRKRILLGGYVLFAVGSTAILLANSAGAVIAIRALLGVGGAMIMPTTLSLIRVIFTDPKERATALSIWAAVSGLGAVIGPLVGGVLLEYFTWKAAFLINVPLMVAAIGAGLMLLPESTVASPGRWDGIAAGLSLVGMISLVWAIKQFGKHATLQLTTPWLATLIGVVTLTWFVVRTLNSTSPLIELSLFQSRPFTAGIVAALGSTFALIAALLLVVQWLQLVDGASPIQTGIRLIPIAISGSAAALIAPGLSRIIGVRVVISGALVASGFGMSLLAIAGNDLRLSHVITSLCFIGVGIGSLAVASAMIMAGTAEDHAGSAGALEETSYELGATLGVAVLGSISALVYRNQLRASPVFEQLNDFSPELATQASDSLGAGMAIAQDADLPTLVATVGEAFTSSLRVAGASGAVIMVLVAVAVFLLTPRGFQLAGAKPEPV